MYSEATSRVKGAERGTLHTKFVKKWGDHVFHPVPTSMPTVPHDKNFD